MLAKTLLCIAAAVQFAKLSPKGKYFLIETQDKGETGDDGETKDNVETNDYAETKEDPLKPMMTNEGNSKTVVFNKATMFVVLELKRVKDALPKKQKKIFNTIYKNKTMLAEFSKMAMTSYNGDVDKVRNLFIKQTWAKPGAALQTLL